MSKNPVLLYCEMSGANINSSANGWMLVNNDLLSVYNTQLGVTLNNMYFDAGYYYANLIEGSIRTFSLPVPAGIRGIRIEYINLENNNFATGTVNVLDLADVYNASIGTNVFLGSGVTHFGISVHAVNNANSQYLSNSNVTVVLDSISETLGANVFFWGSSGPNVKLANLNLVGNSMIHQTDDLGFDLDRIVISQLDTANSAVNIKDMRIWIR